jgi:hypothetical protein
MDKKYIGNKKIKEVITLEEKTPVGSDIMEVEYVDGTKEVLSKMMYDETVSEKSCDLTDLRDKRIRPVVASVLLIFREWGIKISETAYFSALLNQSLDHNKDEAQKELWKQWKPTLQSLEDVDYITIDRILKSIKTKEIPSPYDKTE